MYIMIYHILFIFIQLCNDMYDYRNRYTYIYYIYIYIYICSDTNFDIQLTYMVNNKSR